MTGVSGKSDTEARSPAVSMISATLARSGPGESLGGAGHSRTTPRKGRVVPDKRLTQLYRPEKRAFRIRPAGRQFVRPEPETLALGTRHLCRRYKASWSDISTCRSVYRRADDEGFMHSTSNTYLGLSKATRLVSSPMMVPRAASLDSFTGTPRAAPIRA